MNIIRPVASLNPALLARKGGASPAMRSSAGGADNDLDDLASSQEALGWNDMGEERRITPDRRANRRAAFTLRLDAPRHLKLRLASALQETSAQVLVTEALDRFLETLPQVEILAAQAGQHKSDKS